MNKGTVFRKPEAWRKGNLPVVAVRVGEVTAVPAPEDILSRLDNDGACCFGLCESFSNLVTDRINIDLAL